MQGLRSHLDAAQIKYDGCREDRILIEEYIGRIVVHVDAIEIVLKARSDTQNGLYIHNGGSLEPEAPEAHSIRLPWTKKCTVAKKGISHQPSRPASLRPDTQQAILNAIAKARKWLDDLVTGRFSSIEEIAGDEEITERYVRQLMSLAFASPEFVRTILRREGSENLTLTALASSFPVSWPVADPVIAGTTLKQTLSSSAGCSLPLLEVQAAGSPRVPVARSLKGRGLKRSQLCSNPSRAAFA